jgi:hypothetical protein
MILPTKHTNFSQSLLGFGSYILTKTSTATSIDTIWTEYQKDYISKAYLAKHSFDNLIHAIVFLYSIGAVEEQDGGVVRCG